MKKTKIKGKRNKRLSRSAGGDVAVWVLLLFVAVFMALPFVYAILQAFKPMEEIFIFPPRFFVQNPTFDNFYKLSIYASDMWVPLSRYIFNSLFVSVTSTAAHVIIASMAAYSLAKYKFFGSEVINHIIVLSLLFTPEVTAIPRYIVMSNLGLINNYFALILPAIGAPLGLFLMRQFIKNMIPNGIIEAAKIDGAGTMVVFWKIVMPNVKPAWLTLMIFSFQASWNAEGLEFIYSENLKVLPTMLKQISNAGIATVGVGAAAAVILMIPPLIMFVFSQSRVIQTMGHSGIKE